MLNSCRQVKAAPALRNCIFGEATLNDALSIVLFNLVQQHVEDFQVERFFKGIISELCFTLFGSVLIGISLNLLGAYITRRLLFLRLSGASREPMPHMELGLMTTVALFTYSAAERLSFSGIMALFVGGATTRHYTFYNLSAEAREGATNFFLSLANLAEVALATLLGVAAFDYLT